MSVRSCGDDDCAERADVRLVIAVRFFKFTLACLPGRHLPRCLCGAADYGYGMGCFAAMRTRAAA